MSRERAVRKKIKESLMKVRYSSVIKVIILTILFLVISNFSYAAYRKTDPKKPIQPTEILPKNVRWGCLVCHDDKNLSKIVKGKEKSLFTDPDIISKSIHKNIACTDCHTNFSYTGHPAKVPEDYVKVAGLSCQKCHPYQFQQYKKSTHYKLIIENSKKKSALCSDCHGNHGIKNVTSKEGNLNFRLQSRWVCSKCHEERTITYNDYYHGAAYKKIEKDSPACWDCHNNHFIVGSKNAESSVNENNLPQTCSKCHTNPGLSFTNYGQMMHGRNEMLNKNKIGKIYFGLFPEKKQNLSSIVSAPIPPKSYQIEERKGLIGKIMDIFFPPSLRPMREQE